MMGFGFGNGYMMAEWGPVYGYGYGTGLASGFGGGYWWNGLIVLGIQLIPLILLIAVGVALFRWIGKRIPTTPNSTGNVMIIASERYARGEINKDDYMNLKKTLLN